MGNLYLVGTPIGNLEDMTFRAVRVLHEVSVIAAEDTRTTGKLLKRYAIETPLVSYHEFSGPEKVAELVARLASADVALVSDAGMPSISDPGYRLVRAAIDAGINVIPIPGPSAVSTALIASGLPTDSFLFLGFLPRQQKARRAALQDAAPLPHTLIVYESPNRLTALLEDIAAVLGQRQLCVARELTKLYEELVRGTPAAALAHFGSEQVRGEVTVVIAGAEPDSAEWDENQVRAALAAALTDGLSRKDAAAQVAAVAGWRKRHVYDLSLTLS
ncbi:MAG: 16S rRNA (cytidine(1402)-2'-O)-methyltransferase [Anaerolineae bacterium]|nr:16S rRNA (cytidine(1402)-2'-O)-methyltransferase [Anaerolineae bacterium]